MKNVVILTGVDLTYKDRVNKITMSGVIIPISKIFRIFAQAIGRKAKAWFTVSNVSLAVASVAALVGWCAALVASETDSNESRTTLAVCSLIGMVGLGISLYKDGMFNLTDEELENM